MRFTESHFWYSKSQRNGILILATLITLLQILLYFTDELFPPPQTAADLDRLEEIRRQLDSLQNVHSPRETPQIYPFNPNYINDYKGYLLGMSTEEIDRLLNFRKQGKFLRSAREFQDVTGVSDSLLKSLSGHFKFPSWPKQTEPKPFQKPRGAKKDLNRATSSELQEIRGIGLVRARRILAYRDHLRGFSFESQLNEVYHLPEEVVERVLEHFEIKEPPAIEKININTASFKQILDLPYIDYNLTRKIIAFRSEEKLITDLSDLKKIDSFPTGKYDRIAVYLLAE